MRTYFEALGVFKEAFAVERMWIDGCAVVPLNTDNDRLFAPMFVDGEADSIFLEWLSETLACKAAGTVRKAILAIDNYILANAGCGLCKAVDKDSPYEFPRYGFLRICYERDGKRFPTVAHAFAYSVTGTE